MKFWRGASPGGQPDTGAGGLVLFPHSARKAPEDFGRYRRWPARQAKSRAGKASLGPLCPRVKPLDREGSEPPRVLKEEQMGFTIGIVKPDATGRLGEILERVTRAGFVIDEVRVLTLTRDEVAVFYGAHLGRAYYEEHAAFMTSGPCVFLVLTHVGLGRDESAETLRVLLGATSPSEAAPGTIRHDFGSMLPRNAMHGSADANEAAIEIGHLRRFCAARGDDSLVPPRVG